MSLFEKKNWLKNLSQNFSHTLSEKYWLLWLLVIYVAIRSFHFAATLDFSTDQALFSLKALDIWRNHHFTLLGPTFSINFQGRYAFQGSAIYYMQLFFLLLGRWDPIASSYIFMLFSAVMIFPLFYGTKLLLKNRAAAFLITIIYTLLPYYIDYTRFLWNPNFQFSLVPILILLTGLFCASSSTLHQNARKNFLCFFLLSIWSGLLLQFHYQFALILGGYFVYFFVIKRLNWKYFLLWFAGLAIGFSPLIFFELRHHFYNLQTLWLFSQTILTTHTLPLSSSGSAGFNAHYFLSLSLFVLLLLIAMLRKYISWPVVTITTVILTVWSLFLYFPKPTHAFGMPAHWNYLKEEQANQLIRTAIITKHLTSYNIVSLNYDTLAPVQKYLLTRDEITGATEENFDNYVSNHYLFVIATPEELRDTKAYEVTSIALIAAVQSQQINGNYFLYLFQRD